MLWDQSYTIVFDINIPVTYLNLARKEVQFYWLFSFLKRVETQTLQKIQLRKYRYRYAKFYDDDGKIILSTCFEISSVEMVY